MAEPVEAEPQAGAHRRPKNRSTPFPFLSLPAAIERVQVLYSRDKKATVPREVAIKHWGFSSKSSYAQQTIGALRSYGLLDIVGTGSVRLSERALRLMVHPRESREWWTAAREAALAPKVHSRLWERFAADLPSDEALVAVLVLEEGFATDEAARGFVSKYRETLAFARMAEAGNISVAATPDDDGGEPLEDEMPALAPNPAPPVASASPMPSASKLQAPAPDPDSLLLQVPFRGSTMTVRISAGQKLTKAHLDRVCAYLKLAGDDFEPPAEE